MQKFSLGTNFPRQAAPAKIKPTKICTHEELATVINTCIRANCYNYIPEKRITFQESWSMMQNVRFRVARPPTDRRMIILPLIVA